MFQNDNLWRFSFIEKESDSNIKQISYVMKIIKERYENITYWAENILLMNIKCRSYWKKTVIFYRSRVDRNPINHYNQHAFLKMHNIPQIDLEIASRYPFELLYELNSTIGRIITWFKWKLNFFLTKSFENILNSWLTNSPNFIIMYEK